MQSGLKSIAKLLPPPRSPRGLDRSWEAVERELGLSLPNDYKAFIDLYGTGQVSSAGGWLVIWNFRDASLWQPKLSDLLNGPGSVGEFYRQVINGSQWPCPYPIYPDVGGILPFASVVDVNHLNWLTTGRANRWNVVYYFCDGQKFTLLEGDSFTGCLLKILRREYADPEVPRPLVPPYEFIDLPGYVDGDSAS